jgi:Rps23 Pro-64 3,4-dihydroxylase Tpa1-like proline 4-hydroxylase
MDELLSDAYALKLRLLAEESAAEYRTNKPFPYIYFDNFLPAEAAEAALRDYPEPKEVPWTQFNNEQEKKLAFDAVEKLPEGDRNVLYFLNSRPMLQFLEILTGIKGVIPDPYFVGGGLHQIVPGGKLGVHADFNKHEKLNLDRRINVLIYLNKDWKEEYGGHFELWNREMTRAEAKILPVFNRCAIFSTTSWSYHGHPTPLSCPPDRTRKSIATYYYTNGRPAEEVTEAHSTLFQLRPGEVLPEQAVEKHSEVPPGIVVAYPHPLDVLDRRKFTLGKLAWAMTPPLLYELYKKARDRNADAAKPDASGTGTSGTTETH